MPAHRQTGVALLTVLVVVFLASVAATSLISVQQLAIRRSTLVQHQQQAQLYARGGEQWAKAILIRDLEEGQTDHLGEIWASLPPTLPVEGGGIAGDIQDLQGRFNLNNLFYNQTFDENWFRALQRLLDALELDPGIAQAIADWLDPDIEPRFPDGAEDGEYVGYTPPYVAANRPLVSVSELRLIKGMDEEGFRRLAPYVCTLPERTPINVNTAPAPVLASLADELSLAEAEALIETRALEVEGYPDVNAFLNAAQLGEDALPQDHLAVNSRYFRVRVEANVGEGRAILNTLLTRNGEGGIRILMRSLGNDAP